MPKPSTVNPHCRCGKPIPDDPYQVCDNCFLRDLRREDRYGLWQPVRPALLLGGARPSRSPPQSNPTYTQTDTHAQ
jgi:hypothetical protein